MEKRPVTDYRHPSSFRDPSGFIFKDGDMVYRHIGAKYKENYDRLMSSGLYAELTKNHLLIPHQERGVSLSPGVDAYKVLEPKHLRFISYPYEWSFSQLKEAALVTLDIQKRALKFGMTLKDCSAYNIQFDDGNFVFIDTLSFEKYNEGAPWMGYRQFCQHFLAPLALAAYIDVRFQQLFRIFIDGVPLDFASKLLPFSTYFHFSLFSHIHLHARSQKYYGRKTITAGRMYLSRFRMEALIDHLESAIRSLRWKDKGTEWGDYYTFTNYSSDSLVHKQELLEEFLLIYRPNFVWDLGSNTGIFSRLASKRGIFTVAFDIDYAAVEKSVSACREKKEKYLLPLFLDLANPSSGIGWAHTERMSLRDRGPADMVLALALIHHIAISNNVPFDAIASFFSDIGKIIVVEFIPKSDSQVKKILATREDIFSDYTEAGFEKAFSHYFVIEKKVPVRGSERTLYCMRKI